MKCGVFPHIKPYAVREPGREPSSRASSFGALEPARLGIQFEELLLLYTLALYKRVWYNSVPIRKEKNTT